MNKREFIKAIREMADELEKGNWKMINIKSGYIFGNKNYGEINLKVAEGLNISVNLYYADEDEKKEV